MTEINQIDRGWDLITLIIMIGSSTTYISLENDIFYSLKKEIEKSCSNI